MALYKRSTIWWYSFWFKKKRYQGSTMLKNKSLAKLAEAKARTNAALEYQGLLPPRLAQVFKEFATGRFTEHIEQHNKNKPRTISFYKEKIRRLLEYAPIANARLNEIDEKLHADYQQWRAGQKRRSRGDGPVAVASINRETATLRKALYLAYKWKLIHRKPSLESLPGEHERTFTVDGTMETAYLAKADYPLRQSAILIIDLGLRPDECVRIRKPDIVNGRLFVRSGKTDYAARSVLLTERAATTIEFLFALWPDSIWLFPGRRKDRHLTVWALDNLHRKIRELMCAPKEFCLYSLRHTFGTRLAESGGSPYDVKDLMGHSDVRVSQKYIHPSPEHVDRAMRRKEALDKILRGEVPTVLEEPAQKKL